MEASFVWESQEDVASEAPRRSLFITSRGPLLRISDVGSFYFLGNRIVAKLEDPAKAATFVLGKVFGLWLELAGIPVLHGSCLACDAGAVGFLGFSGMGKSTLAAAFRESGRLLLTDDLIPLPPGPDRPIIFPGIPFSRVWPDTGKVFYRSFEQSEKVHPQFEKRKISNNRMDGRLFAEESHALSALFVLNRTTAPSKATIERLSPARALTELIRMSYHPDLVQALRLQAQRIPSLSRIVERVPVFGLSYPSGYDQLDGLRQLILETCQSESAPSPLSP